MRAVPGRIVRGMAVALAATVLTAGGGWVAGAASAARSAPDPGWAPPAEVARFFADLTPAERLRLARRHPGVVGNLDGAPVALRYQANAWALAAVRDRERRRAADLALAPATRRAAAARAGRYATLLAPSRRILAFDPRGRGLVAEVHGDLPGARRVAVVVPGSDIDLTSFDRAERPLGTPHGMAAALRAEATRLDGAGTAVIAWAGYVAPRGLGLPAATAAHAVPGAQRLRRLVAGLRAAGGPGDRPAVTVFCHSYGSVVCGLAAPGLAVTDLVAFGSPGMRAGTVSGLRARAHVWAARADGDWIGRIPHVRVLGLGHGADPVSTPFGARVVSAAGAGAHDRYLAPGAASLRNFALITLGRYADVTCAPGRECRDGLR